MTYIHAVATQLPPYRYSTREITNKAGTWLQDNPNQMALFERLASSTKIEFRNFAIPIDELLALKGSEERTRIFKEVGSVLLTQVIDQALRTSNASPTDVTTLITTSCSVPVIPAIDASVIQEIGLSPTVTRLPIFQYGCAGGAIGLSLAGQLTSSSGTTLLSSVELCSMVYQSSDLQGGNIVGSAIFGDGAACVALSNDPGPLRLVASQSVLIPGTADLMGYDILDDGTHLRLDREIPQALVKAAPRAITEFLHGLDMTNEDIQWWLFHPGGAKILASLHDSLNIEHNRSRWSWESLRDYGNMSSASILFALSGFLADREYNAGDRMVMVGVGPGLTLQINLFECL